MTTETAPRGNGPTSTATWTALAFLIAVSAASPACLIAVYFAPQSLRAATAWTTASCGLLLCAAVTVAVHQLLTARRLRGLVARRDAAAAAERADAERFADVTVPDVVARIRSGATADSALSAVPEPTDDTHRRVLRVLADEAHRGEGRRAAAMTACANAASRVQALTTSMAADLREMEHRHQDPDVLADLLHLDHRTAQAGRLADSIAVLTGARSGRRWAKPIRMESILRGAMGRIQGYQRVRLHSTSEVAVAGHAAEGVMHALAEIMDNAANFSPPTAEVHVYVEEVSAGVVVTVEDGGLAMSEDALDRARDAVEPRSARDLSALPGTRLGLSVVGRLAHKHGLAVSFRPSAHGGTGVLLRIPQALVTEATPPPGSDRSAARTGTAARGVETPRRRPATADTADTDTTDTDTAPKAEPESTPAAAPAPGAHSRAERSTGRNAADRTDGPDHGAAPRTGTDEAREHRRVSHDSSEEREVEYGRSGLPRRRRGQTLAAARKVSDGTPERPRRTRSAAESGSRLGAFHSAVRRDEAPGDAPSGTPDANTAPPASPNPASSRSEDHPA